MYFNYIIKILNENLKILLFIYLFRICLVLLRKWRQLAGHRVRGIL